MMTTKSFQSSKRFVVRSFLQALCEAISVFKHDRVLAKKTLAKWMRTQDSVLLDSAYSGYAPRISLPPYSQLTGIQIVVDDLANTRPDAKGKNAQQFVDEEILRELDKEAFFRRLEKSR